MLGRHLSWRWKCRWWARRGPVLVGDRSSVRPVHVGEPSEEPTLSVRQLLHVGTPADSHKFARKLQRQQTVHKSNNKNDKNNEDANKMRKKRKC